MSVFHKALKAISVISLLMAITVLSACVPKPVEETATEWSGKEELELPADNSALAGRYADYSEKASLAFTSSSVTDISSFDTEEIDGKIKIVKYIGDDNIVVIPESYDEKSIFSIGVGAFSGTAVTAIYIPDSITDIEKGALEGASRLSTLRIPFLGNGNDITHFGYIFNTDSYETHATRVPTSLDMVIVGNADEIADNAFAGCKSLSAVILPDSARSIGRFAFYECADLVYVELGSGIESVGNYAFGYCSSLYSIDLSTAKNIGLGAIYETNNLFSLTVSFVGESTVENRFIGYVFGAENADYNDEFVPKSLRHITVSGSASIPDRAFASCEYITKINLSEGVESIGVRAFYSCRSLESVVLPNSLTAIKDDAFFACESMKSIDFGTGLEEIGMQAFFACSSLDNVKLPDKVTELKSSTFALCSSLTNVDLNKVTKIGQDAFLNCPYSPNN